MRIRVIAAIFGLSFAGPVHAYDLDKFLLGSELQFIHMNCEPLRLNEEGKEIALYYRMGFKEHDVLGAAGLWLSTDANRIAKLQGMSEYCRGLAERHSEYVD